MININFNSQNLQKLIASPIVSEDSKIRLVSLYSLRYEKSPNNAITSLIDLLHRNGVSDRKISVRIKFGQFYYCEQKTKFYLV